MAIQATITLTVQEAQTLNNLLDVALRTKGLDAADACMHFSRKIGAAVQEAKNPNLRSIAPGAGQQDMQEQQPAGEEQTQDEQEQPS